MRGTKANQGGLPGSSLYQTLGQRTGIASIVEDLLYRIVDDPRLNQQFKGVDVAQFHQHLTTLTNTMEKNCA